MTDLNALNEYGVPLHACNGHRHDEHYWAWIRHTNESNPFILACRAKGLF